MKGNVATSFYCVLFVFFINVLACTCNGCSGSDSGGCFSGDGTSGGLTAGGTLSTPSLSDRGSSPRTSQLRDSDYSVKFTLSSDWKSGFSSEIKVTNLGRTRINNWKLEFDFNRSIDSIWCASIVSNTGSHYVLKGADWNSWIEPGASVSFGFCGSPGGLTTAPSTWLLSGDLPVTPTPAPTPSSTSTPSSEGSVAVDYTTSSDWGSGFTGSIVLKNAGASTVQDWVLEFDFDRTIDSIWNASVESHSGTHYRIKPESYNRVISSGGRVSFGFTGSPGNVSLPPENAVVTAIVSTPDPSVTPTPGPTPGGTSTPSPSPTLTSTPTPTPTPTATPTISPSVTPSPTPTATSTPSDKRIVAYFTSWSIYDRGYNVTDIPADRITHINYAFFGIDGANNTVTIFDPWADTQKVFTGAASKGFPDQTWEESARGEAGNLGRLRQLKKLYPSVRTLMSVGGWTLSYNFPKVAGTSASRRTFVTSCVTIMKQYDFDGIDIDWEYPEAADKTNCSLLLEEFRSQLDAQSAKDNCHYLLTLAGPAGSDKLVNLELARLSSKLDFINIMTYDYHGGWDSTTNHQSPLYMNPADPVNAFDRERLNISWTVNAYLNSGVPAAKLSLGIPFYGRAWEGVSSTGSGLFQAGPALPSTNVPGNWEAGMLDYWKVIELQRDTPRYRRLWDSASMVPWLYGKNLSSRNDGGLFITYDDVESVTGKIAFLNSKGLGGVMFWELSGDMKNTGDPACLIQAIYSELNK